MKVNCDYTDTPIEGTLGLLACHQMDSTGNILSACLYGDKGS